MTAYEQHGTATIAAANPFQASPGIRIAVVQGSEPDDWRDIYDRLTDSSHRLVSILLKSSTALAVFIATAAVSGALALLVRRCNPDISPYYDHSRP